MCIVYLLHFRLDSGKWLLLNVKSDFTQQPRVVVLNLAMADTGNANNAFPALRDNSHPHSIQSKPLNPHKSNDIKVFQAFFKPPWTLKLPVEQHPPETDKSVLTWMSDHDV